MRGRRAVAVVLIVAANVLAGAPANAGIGACLPGFGDTSPPSSMAPSEVPGAILDPPSATLPPGVTPPAAGTPSVPNTLANYGWAGFAWPDYDTGCGGTLALDDRLAGATARLGMGALVGANAATTGAARYAYNPASYDIATQIGRSLDAGLGDNFARPAFWIVAVLLGGVLVATADRRSPREHASTAGLVLALGASVVAVSMWNATLGPTIDKTLVRVVSAANAAATPAIPGGPPAPPGGTPRDAGQAIGESFRTNIALTTWRRGMFGPSTATANTFGDSLFAAGAISNPEAAVAGSSPAEMGKLADADKKDYETVAGQIKKADPRGYEYLAGHRNASRMFYLTLGWLTWLSAGSFQAVAAFAVAYALTLVRIILGLWSAIALVGLLRRAYAIRALGILAGALIAGTGLSVLAAASRYAAGWLLASPATLWASFGLAVLCVITWVLAWPVLMLVPGTPERFRRLRRRASGALDAIVDDGELAPAENSPSPSPAGAGRTGRDGAASATVSGGSLAEAWTGRSMPRLVGVSPPSAAPPPEPVRAVPPPPAPPARILPPTAEQPTQPSRILPPPAERATPPRTLPPSAERTTPPAKVLPSAEPPALHAGGVG